ncbi:MAG: hypothetical protein E5W40_08740 [Mesorhizobium sp.]|nr:MAG: hypothetical protein E5W40_08740 [Mesorhizobium sp.]
MHRSVFPRSLASCRGHRRRIFRQNHAMLLENHTAVRKGRVHDGKVVVLRWCSSHDPTEKLAVDGWLIASSRPRIDQPANGRKQFSVIAFKYGLRGLELPFIRSARLERETPVHRPPSSSGCGAEMGFVPVLRLRIGRDQFIERSPMGTPRCTPSYAVEQPAKLFHNGRACRKTPGLDTVDAGSLDGSSQEMLCRFSSTSPPHRLTASLSRASSRLRSSSTTSRRLR